MIVLDATDGGDGSLGRIAWVLLAEMAVVGELIEEGVVSPMDAATDKDSAGTAEEEDDRVATAAVPEGASFWDCTTGTPLDATD